MKTCGFHFVLGFLITAALLSTCAYAADAEYEDVIHLKDGSVVRGAIVEEVPGETYKIEIAGGSVLVFDAAEIDYVSRELPTTGEGEGKRPSYRGDGDRYRYRPLLFGFAGVVGTFGSDVYNILLYGGELLVGWRLHPIYAVGLGFGYNHAAEGDHYSYNPWSYHLVPKEIITVITRGRITSSRFT